jgi:hypothetical protein
LWIFAGNGWKVTGKNPKNSGRNTASISHRFSRVFLQDSVTFPPLSGGICSFSEAEIIDLGRLHITEKLVHQHWKFD